jgi:rhodanese-related sulfurtransferase
MSQLFEFFGNHPVLTMALVAALAMLIGSELQRRLRSVRDIGPMEAIRLMNQQDALFIDTRTEAEYKEGHILDALHIPLGDLERRASELNKYKDRPLIAYCRSGHRSASAGGKLKKLGFETVHNLGGGIMAWQSANLPVTRK